MWAENCARRPTIGEVTPPLPWRLAVVVALLPTVAAASAVIAIDRRVDAWSFAHGLTAGSATAILLGLTVIVIATATRSWADPWLLVPSVLFGVFGGVVLALAVPEAYLAREGREATAVVVTEGIHVTHKGGAFSRDIRTYLYGLTTKNGMPIPSELLRRGGDYLDAGDEVAIVYDPVGWANPVPARSAHEAAGGLTIGVTLLLVGAAFGVAVCLREDRDVTGWPKPRRRRDDGYPDHHPRPILPG